MERQPTYSINTQHTIDGYLGNTCMFDLKVSIIIETVHSSLPKDKINFLYRVCADSGTGPTSKVVSAIYGWSKVAQTAHWKSLFGENVGGFMWDPSNFEINKTFVTKLNSPHCLYVRRLYHTGIDKTTGCWQKMPRTLMANQLLLPAGFSGTSGINPCVLMLEFLKQKMSVGKPIAITKKMKLFSLHLKPEPGSSA